jgi:hypothetical protein
VWMATPVIVIIVVLMVRSVMMRVIVLVLMMLVSADAVHASGGGVAHRRLGAFGTTTDGTHQDTSSAMSSAISIDLINSPSPPSGRVRFSEPQKQPRSKSYTSTSAPQSRQRLCAGMRMISSSEPSRDVA